MDEYNLINLPLFEDADYNYVVSLNRVAYSIRLYYNERMQQWIMDFKYADGTPIVLGQGLSPRFPLYLDYLLELPGFFWLEPIGKYQNETVINPFQLSKYYKLYYVERVNA